MIKDKVHWDQECEGLGFPHPPFLSEEITVSPVLSSGLCSHFYCTPLSKSPIISRAIPSLARRNEGAFFSILSKAAGIGK